MEAKNEAVTVPQADNTDLLEVDVSQCSRVAVQIAVTGQALDAFVIQGKAHKDAAYVSMFSAAADFTSPAGLIVDASGDLTTLAAAATGWVVLDVLGLSMLKVLASSGNAAGSTVSAYLTGS